MSPDSPVCNLAYLRDCYLRIAQAARETASEETDAASSAYAATLAARYQLQADELAQRIG